MHPRLIPPSLALAAVLAAGGVQSQQAMVSVDLSDVAGQLARHNGLDESLVPLSMLVPTEVAAKVCGAPPGGQAFAAGGCKAASNSTELEALVKERMQADEQPPAALPLSSPAD